MVRLLAVDLLSIEVITDSLVHHSIFYVFTTWKNSKLSNTLQSHFLLSQAIVVVLFHLCTLTLVVGT